ncbi:hypothetical protein CWI38_0558p0030 [Hamiltosporidium tvaerminnensis]|uniref:Leucine-rich repeat-containing protein n=1 Tax=Hamiltosporidium tvaerminnensis TaxID=1176355 RepID=A0A4Q9LYZ6_9MICR|nr:hypothetical protein CWI38_0558p0030 [Hamiltosporidium tvaerminnensis]
MVDSTNSFNPTNINNSKESFQAESFISPHNRCSSSATPNCSSEDIQHKEYDSNKRRRLDDANKTENTQCHFTGQTSHTTNDVCTGGVINQNSPAIFSFWNRNTIENAIKFPGDIQIVLPLEPINIVRFDYSENYMIRSMYLDEFNNVKTSKKEINIQDITNSNIDSSLFEECIYVLRYGWNCNFLGIKKENFLNLISLIYDLKCYSNSDALLTLYKSLLTYIFVYLENRSFNDTFDLTKDDFITHKKHFLPFIYVLYDSIKVTYDLDNKELTFIEKKNVKKEISIQYHDVDEIIIRITPRALELIDQERHTNKSTILNCIISVYKTKGIKISSDNSFFYESKNSDSVRTSAINKLQIENMNTSFIFLFNSMKFIERREVISIEFERIVVSKIDMFFLGRLIYLKTLTLVQCTFKNFKAFYRAVSSKFPELQNLRFVGLNLLTGFLNNLCYMKIEILELLFCNFTVDLRSFKPRELIKLKKFKMNYTSIKFRIIESMMLSKTLEVLSLKGVAFTNYKYPECFENWQKYFRSLDLSYCKLCYTSLKFFSENIKAEKLYLNYFQIESQIVNILNQKSLHISTRKLSLCGNRIDSKLFYIITHFEVLEYLNLSSLKENSYNFYMSEHKFYSKLVDLNLSGNKIKEISFGFAKQLDRLVGLNLFNCNLKPGSLSDFCLGFMNTSLKRINLAGNVLHLSDIIQIGLLINLENFVLSLDNKVFSEFIEKYSALSFQNLETLILILTNLDDAIINFIISQPSLKSIELRNCTIRDKHQIDCKLTPDGFKRRISEDSEITIIDT